MLEHGADPSLQSHDGNTAYSVARGECLSLLPATFACGANGVEDEGLDAGAEA